MPGATGELTTQPDANGADTNAIKWNAATAQWDQSPPFMRCHSVNEPRLITVRLSTAAPKTIFFVIHNIKVRQIAQGDIV